MKKFTLFLASLFLTIGAMAQTLADGVYTIQADENGKRGYLAANADYDRPVLTEISWDTYAGNSAEAMENGKYWYLKTVDGVSYLYSVAKGQFIYDNGTDNIFFGNVCALNVTETGNYIHVGSGTGTRFLSMGCGAKAPEQVKWEKSSPNDGGCLLTFTLVENGTTTFAEQVAAADAAVNEYVANLVPEVVITNVEDLNNNKVYTMVTTRGWLIYNSANPDVVASTASYTTFATGADVAACQWAIYKSPTTSKYYLYNIGAGKFVGQNTGEGGRFPFVEEVTNDIQVVKNTAGTEYALVFSTDNYGAINHFSHTTEPGVANWKGNASSGGLRSLNDAGSAHRVVEVADIDPSVLEVIAAAVTDFESSARTITYKFMYGGTVVATQVTETEKGEAYPAFNVPNVPLGIVPAEEVPTGVVEDNAEFEIELTVNNDLIPFEYVAEGTPSVWYYARMHGNGAVTSYIEDNGSETIEWSDKNIEASEIDSHLWGFVGDAFNGFKMVNKGTGDAIASTGSGNATMAEVASATAFHAMASDNGTPGAFCLKYKDNDNYINAQDGIIKHWNDNDNGSTFFLTEYSNEDVATLEVSAANYATLFLGEPVYVPAGVEAYVVESAENGWIDLVKVDGILPANTGIVLKKVGEEAAYTFTLAPTRISEVGTNLLTGTLVETEITKEEGNSYYILANGENGVGFYNPVLGEDITKFNNAANKAYLVVPAEQAEGIACYSFRFGEGTTGIDEVTTENGNVKAIYDLTGRRVEAITAPGIYIVNGKKTLVK